MPVSTIINNAANAPQQNDKPSFKNDGPVAFVNVRLPEAMGGSKIGYCTFKPDTAVHAQIFKILNDNTKDEDGATPLERLAKQIVIDVQMPAPKTEVVVNF